MANKPYGTLSYSVKDYSGETGVITMKMAEYNVGTYDVLLTDIGTLRNALFINSGFTTGICWGTGLYQEKQTLFIDDMLPVPPTDENILRGRKWSVRYYDNVTFQKYTASVPCAIATDLLIANSDRADLSKSAWVAFKSAFEAVVKSPFANDVTISSAWLVGRRL